MTQITIVAIEKKQVPNLITASRVALVPFFLALMAFRESLPSSLSLVPAILFGVAALSDWLDGYLARKWHATSDFGKFFDPLADKILVITALVMLIGEQLPAWLVAAHIGRDMLISGVRAQAASKGISVPAIMSAKIKTALTMVGVLLLLLEVNYCFFIWKTPYCLNLGLALVFIALGFSLYSGWIYMS